MMDAYAGMAERGAWAFRTVGGPSSRQLLQDDPPARTVHVGRPFPEFRPCCAAGLRATAAHALGELGGGILGGAAAGWHAPKDSDGPHGESIGTVDLYCISSYFTIGEAGVIGVVDRKGRTTLLSKA